MTNLPSSWPLTSLWKIEDDWRYYELYAQARQARGNPAKTFSVYGTMSALAVSNSILKRGRFIRLVEILIDMPNVLLGSLSPDERQCFCFCEFYDVNKWWPKE